MNTKIIILGCGYLGYNLAVGLHNLKCDVTVIGITNDYTNHLPPNIRFVEQDLFTVSELSNEKYRNGIFINSVGFLNATHTLNESTSVLQSSLKLFSNIIRVISKVEGAKLVQLSSGGTVYGATDKMMLSENASLNPVNIYGLEKVFMEQYIRINSLENNTLPYMILRLGNPFGGYQLRDRGQGIIPILIRFCLNDRAFQLWADEKTVRDYIHIDNVIYSINELMTNQNSWNKTINLGTGKGQTIVDLIKLVEKICGKSLKVVKKESNTSVIPYNVLDVSKLQSLIEVKENLIEEDILKEYQRILREG